MNRLSVNSPLLILLDTTLILILLIIFPVCHFLCLCIKMCHFTEAASTSDAVSLITYVQQLKREVLAWEKQVDIYREAQRILERQR